MFVSTCYFFTTLGCDTTSRLYGKLYTSESKRKRVDLHSTVDDVVAARMHEYPSTVEHLEKTLIHVAYHTNRTRDWRPRVHRYGPTELASDISSSLVSKPKGVPTSETMER